MRRLIMAMLLLLPALVWAEAAPSEADNTTVADDQIDAHINELKEPLYSPFVERYILDEVRTLRIDMERKFRELGQEVVDRELGAADKAIGYATSTVTYFFYLIAGASSLLVLVGWSSLRDIKEKVHSAANQQVAELVEKYERRLRVIESQLQQETAHIESNREEISLTQEVHSLWLRASQESNPAAKIAIYDQILTLRPGDTEAISYKADAALEQGEPLWAINLCQQALEQDDSNGHAFYQMACAQTAVDNLDEAARYFLKAVEQSDSYRDELFRDPDLAPLTGHPLLSESSLAAQSAEPDDK